MLSQKSMERVKLTNELIKSTNSPKTEDRIEITDNVIPSLIIRIGSLRKVFYYRFREGKSVKRRKVGEFPQINVSEARRIVKLFDFERTQFGGVIKLKYTLNDVYESYVKIHLPKKKKSTSTDYQIRMNKHVLPVFGNMKIDKITSSHLSTHLNEIYLKTPTSSNRVKAILSSVFSFAVANNFANTNPVLSIPQIYRERPRDRIYSKSEMFGIMNAVEREKEPIKSNLLLIILTGQRVNEINSLKWRDVLLEEKKITIRGENTKNSRSQVLPIIPSILNVLTSIKSSRIKGSEYLFPTTTNPKEYRKTMSSILKRLKKVSNVPDLRLHDIRSKMATVLSEKGVDRTTVGKLLNHKQMAGDNSVTGYHYDSYDYFIPKKKALDEWNRYIYEEVLKEGYLTESASKFFSSND